MKRGPASSSPSSAGPSSAAAATGAPWTIRRDCSAKAFSISTSSSLTSTSSYSPLTWLPTSVDASEPVGPPNLASWSAASTRSTSNTASSSTSSHAQPSTSDTNAAAQPGMSSFSVQGWPSALPAGSSVSMFSVGSSSIATRPANLGPPADSAHHAPSHGCWRRHRCGPRLRGPTSRIWPWTLRCIQFTEREGPRAVQRPTGNGAVPTLGVSAPKTSAACRASETAMACPFRVHCKAVLLCP
mmetsp:Transcript_66445/g.187188  ORF Transcript_66445/g.187188 Transcript_66445/m.187188 type:complete len:242 (+) Transcript_66445:160-885(+)